MSQRVSTRLTRAGLSFTGPWWKRRCGGVSLVRALPYSLTSLAHRAPSAPRAQNYLTKSIIASGVTPEAAQLAVTKGQETMDIMRSYLRNRNGINTDNGFALDLMNNPVILSDVL